MRSTLARSIGSRQSVSLQVLLNESMALRIVDGDRLNSLLIILGLPIATGLV